jgi:hypothetical protein
MKKQIIGSVVAITAAILISGCSDKNQALKNTLNKSDRFIKSNMAIQKGKDIYVIFHVQNEQIEIDSLEYTPLSLQEYRKLMLQNYLVRDKQNALRKDCILLKNNNRNSFVVGECLEKKYVYGGPDKDLNDDVTLQGYQTNSIYYTHKISPSGVVIGGIFNVAMLPFYAIAGAISPFTPKDDPNNPKSISNDNTFTMMAAPYEFDKDIFGKIGVIINNSLYKQYQKTISDYQQATSIEDKKKYEEQYYKFVNLANVFNKIISKEGKALNVNDDVGLNGLITNTQANGTLKLQAKIGLNPNNKYDIPVKYGTHTFKVRFDFLLKYRISGMGISMDQDETISRVAMVTLSPNNNYSTIINVDFGKYVQSSQSKLLLFSGGQQVIGTKLNVEFEDE